MSDKPEGLDGMCNEVLRDVLLNNIELGYSSQKKEDVTNLLTELASRGYGASLPAIDDYFREHFRVCSSCEKAYQRSTRVMKILDETGSGFKERLS